MMRRAWPEGAAAIDQLPVPPLPPEALHLPFEAGPFRMAMALTACPPGELVEIDDRYPAEMAERRALLACRHGEVFAACAGSEAARAETLRHVAELLPRRHPGWFSQDGRWLRNHLAGERWDLASPAHDPLEVAGRLVQEDLCLIEATAGGPVLQAALLCAPSRWLLADKIGRPLAAVHANVPLYGERLSAPVDRFMAHLKAGKLAQRLNWSVVDDPALFQPTRKRQAEANPAVTAANAGERLFLRVERQTLARLPASGFVLFAIRVHSYALSRAAADPAVAARLAAAVAAVPDALAAYKNLPSIRAALLGHLQAAAGGRQ